MFGCFGGELDGTLGGGDWEAGEDGLEDAAEAFHVWKTAGCFGRKVNLRCDYLRQVGLCNLSKFSKVSLLRCLCQSRMCNVSLDSGGKLRVGKVRYLKQQGKQG